MEPCRRRPFSLPVWLILVIALLWIPKGECDDETSLRIQPETCCDFGTFWAASGLTCIKFLGSNAAIPDQQVRCVENMNKCCGQAYRAQSCEKGKKNAWAGFHCAKNGKSKNPANNQQRACCEACQYGNAMGLTGENCELGGSDFDNLSGQAYSDCCYRASPTTTNIELAVTSMPISSANTKSTSSDTRNDNGNICEEYNFCGQLCNEEGGRFRCGCSAGFYLADDGRSCLPVSARIDLSIEAVIEDETPKCPAGYQYNATSQDCDDIDECASDSACRDPSEMCENTHGSFRCIKIVVAENYDRKIINPWIEMSQEICSNNGCYQSLDDYIRLEDEEGIRARRRRKVLQDQASTSQPCQPGMKYVENRGCVDMKKCEEDPDACKSNEQCINTSEGFICECKLGFKRDNLTHACIDINVRCENTLGGKNCVRYQPCPTGYTLNTATQICEDDDECILGTHDCSHGYHCRNTLGSYVCLNDSRVTSGLQVAPITSKIVYSKLVASALKTSPRECPHGFEVGKNGQCLDVDECQRSPNPCTGSLQKCVNIIGSFGCVFERCKSGYILDPVSGSGCIDIDECADNTHKCGTGQTCLNRQGDYVCECPDGYAVFPNNQCVDVDECSIYAVKNNGNICEQNSHCENTMGSYRCVCDAGFANVTIDQGLSVCQDVDECQKTSELCDHDCVNTWGSYICLCKRGFRLDSDKKSCTDIDECEEFKEDNLCIGFCKNTPGSYACSCPAGYEFDFNPRICQEIDECTSDHACQDPSGICRNTRGSFHCKKIECPVGYHRDDISKGRCIRTLQSCPFSDLACLRQPLHISYNYVTLMSMLPIPASGEIKLFTINSEHMRDTAPQFRMELIDVRALPSVVLANENCFALRRPAPSQAVLVLTRSIAGPQEIEFDFIIDMYNGTDFVGSTVAKLVISVSERSLISIS